jgi:hypothetical protein
LKFPVTKKLNIKSSHIDHEVVMVVQLARLTHAVVVLFFVRKLSLMVELRKVWNLFEWDIGFSETLVP